MFGNLSLLLLQQYWFVIVSLLGSILVFLFFVQGGQTFIFRIGKSEAERTIIVNALGRKWEFTFTTLVTFGGAFFASFPLFYATSFGGAYWVWMAILFSFVIQAIAYEFRSKPSNILGARTFEIFLFINGSVSPLLVGIAVATFFTGSQFSVTNMNFSQWENPWHGLEAVMSLRNISLGITVLFLARLLGLMYIINSINDEALITKARRAILPNAIPFLAGFLFFAVTLLLADGFAVNEATGLVAIEEYKYLHNFLGMPVILLIFIAGVILIIYSLYRAGYSSGVRPIWCGGSGAVLVVLSLFLVAGYNGTSFYPSVTDLQSSLTIRNSSSSYFTLKTMMYVSFFIPVVIAYIWYAWRAINRSPIDREEVEGKGEVHIY